MKFSFAMPNTVRVKALTQPFELDVTGADQTVMAKRAEELGYDMIPIPEHFIVPTAHVELSGPHYFHSTVAQAFIAGATQRIRVNSCVTLLPLQHPPVPRRQLQQRRAAFLRPQPLPSPTSRGRTTPDRSLGCLSVRRSSSS